jgi:hypothetical protein
MMDKTTSRATTMRHTGGQATSPIIRRRWTPVGAYAALAGLLTAIGLSAAALMHQGEHGSIPWSTLPIGAQRFAEGGEGVGFFSAVVLLAMMMVAHRLFEVSDEARRAWHLALAAVLGPAVLFHGALAITHVLMVPAETIHIGLVALGTIGVLLILALATTGVMIERGVASRLPRLVHGPLALALTLVISGHIVVAASHSAMHNSFT